MFGKIFAILFLNSLICMGWGPPNPAAGRSNRQSEVERSWRRRSGVLLTGALPTCPPYPVAPRCLRFDQGPPGPPDSAWGWAARRVGRRLPLPARHGSASRQLQHALVNYDLGQSAVRARRDITRPRQIRLLCLRARGSRRGAQAARCKG